MWTFETYEKKMFLLNNDSRLNLLQYVPDFKTALSKAWEVARHIVLTDRAKDVSEFVTPDGLYHYNVMYFGMKNYSL